VQDGNIDCLNENTKELLEAVSTSCKAIRYTNEASKYARRCCLAMLNYHGLNSLFLITAPDDECSFRVRLYAKPRDWVSELFDKLFYFGIFCLTLIHIELQPIYF
jgi:hypothetical protein